jgi:PAS domain-containing protein
LDAGNDPVRLLPTRQTDGVDEVADPTVTAQAPAVVDDVRLTYDSLLGTLPGVVYTLDRQGVFTSVSSCVESTFGFSGDELIGRHFGMLLHPEDLQSMSRDSILPRFAGVPTGNDRSPKLFDERRSWPRKTDGLQARICPKPGFLDNNNRQVLKCRVNASGRYDQANRFVGTIGVIYNITPEEDTSYLFDRKKPYNAFELLAQALSHVFSNVFTGIYGNLQLIEMQLERPDMFKNNIDSIKQSIENAVTLIRKLTKTVAAPQVCNGAELRKLLLDTAEELLRGGGMDYEYEHGVSLWNTESDPDYIRHIMRAIFFHIVRSADRNTTPVVIRSGNINESPMKLPRIDCPYLRIQFEFTPGPDASHIDDISEFSSLERIASMALSYELLKKIGGHLAVSSSDQQCSVDLFLPATRTS